MSAPMLNAIGQGMALIGVVMLFVFGMPFRVRTGGAASVIANPTEAGKRLECLFDLLGGLGLAAIVAGTAAQIVSNFWPPN